MDFTEFDKKLNNDEIEKQIEKAKENDYTPVPDGKYTVSIESMELKKTKAGDKLMVSASLKIVETLDAPIKQNGRFIFYNRVVFGNNVSEKWNDGVAINLALSWINKITEDGDDVSFDTYSQLANDIAEVFKDYSSTRRLDVTYKGDDFRSVRIDKAYDI